MNCNGFQHRWRLAPVNGAWQAAMPCGGYTMGRCHMGEGCPFTHYENTPPCPFDLANQECPSILGCTFSHTMWVNVRRMPRAWVREVVPIAGQEFCDGSGGFGMARGFSRDSQAAVGSFQSSDRGIKTDSGAEVAAGGVLGLQVGGFISPAPSLRRQFLRLANRLIRKGRVIPKPMK